MHRARVGGAMKGVRGRLGASPLSKMNASCDVHGASPPPLPSRDPHPLPRQCLQPGAAVLVLPDQPQPQRARALAMPPLLALLAMCACALAQPAQLDAQSAQLVAALREHCDGGLCGATHVSPPAPARAELTLSGEGFHRELRYRVDLAEGCGCGLGAGGALAETLAPTPCALAVLQPLPPALYADVYELRSAAAVGLGPQTRLVGPVDVESIEAASQPTVLAVYATCMRLPGEVRRGRSEGCRAAELHCCCALERMCSSTNPFPLIPPCPPPPAPTCRRAPPASPTSRCRCTRATPAPRTARRGGRARCCPLCARCRCRSRWC